MRHQSGTIMKLKGFWVLRYYETNLGQEHRKRLAVKLAPVDKDHSSKTSVMKLAAAILEPVNSQEITVENQQSLASFVESTYLPLQKQKCKPATYRGYHYCWHHYLKPLLGHHKLYGVTEGDIRKALDFLVNRDGISSTTRKNLKHLFSAIYTLAKDYGILKVNPCWGWKKEPTERVLGEAYTFETVWKMMSGLPPRAKTAIALAAYSGCRLSELRGVQWGDLKSGWLRVSRSVWRTHVNVPKDGSFRKVEVHPFLAEVLADWWSLCGRPSDGYILRAHPESGKVPLNLDNEYRRHIKPCLQAAHIEWHGWHAFRRGMATTLDGQDAPVRKIAKMLGHKNEQVTVNHYMVGTKETAGTIGPLPSPKLNKQSPINGLQSDSTTSSSVVN